MFSVFKSLAERPEPFAHADASQLWTRPHIASQMLGFHLDASHDMASRRPEKIDQTVDGIANETPLAGQSVLDLGCGPGLYARRFADKGAVVHGVDFSERAIAYARAHVPAATFGVGNYLEEDLGVDRFDLAVLIYEDVCALSPGSRACLFHKVNAALRPGGLFILDALSRPQFEKLEVETVIENRLMDGFWSASDYVGVKQTILYRDSSIALDRYTIVEPGGHWTVHNWLEYFEPSALLHELAAAGLVQHGPARRQDWTSAWSGEAASFFLVTKKA